MTAAISNANYAQPGGMLDTWAESVLRAGVKYVKNCNCEICSCQVQDTLTLL